MDQLPPEKAQPTPRAPDITPLVKDACASARLVQNVSETNADEATLAQLHRELDGISASYLHVPPGSLVYRAVMLRDRVGRLLQGHQKPAQRRRLLSLGAKSCALLAWMSEDLGDADAAYNQALSAWNLADLADDNEARRWVRVVQSRQAYWQRNFVESAELATDGMTWPSRDGTEVFLILLAARAWAAAGVADKAREELEEWVQTRDGPAFGGDIGLFRLQRDRQAYLAGHAMLFLDDPDAALREFRDSLGHFHLIPRAQRFYAVEVLVRIDMMRVLTRLNEVDEAERVVEPVFDLEPDRLINMIVLSLQNAREELLHNAPGGSPARHLARRIDAFLVSSVVSVGGHPTF